MLNRTMVAPEGKPCVKARLPADTRWIFFHCQNTAMKGAGWLLWGSDCHLYTSCLKAIGLQPGIICPIDGECGQALGVSSEVTPEPPSEGANASGHRRHTGQLTGKLHLHDAPEIPLICNNDAVFLFNELICTPALPCPRVQYR